MDGCGTLSRGNSVFIQVVLSRQVDLIDMIDSPFLDTGTKKMTNKVDKTRLYLTSPRLSVPQRTNKKSGRVSTCDVARSLKLGFSTKSRALKKYTSTSESKNIR